MSRAGSAAISSTLSKKVEVKITSLQKSLWEFPGSPVVSIWHFHCLSPGLVLGWKRSHKPCAQKKEKKSPDKYD